MSGKAKVSIDLFTRPSTVYNGVAPQYAHTGTAICKNTSGLPQTIVSLLPTSGAGSATPPKDKEQWNVPLDQRQ
jgi:hypothetical protein